VKINRIEHGAMTRNAFVYVLLVAILVLSGCATITRGTKEVLVIDSDPVGADVTTSIGLVGKTPATFKVSRKGGFTVTIQKQGYEPVTVQVSSQVAGAGAAGMAGNIILGGLIGAAIDAGSGAMKQLKPNPIQVKLVPTNATKVETDTKGDTANPSGNQPLGNGASSDENTNGNNKDRNNAQKTEKQSVSFRIYVEPGADDTITVRVIEVA
jgi:hypothetical protein